MAHHAERSKSPLLGNAYLMLLEALSLLVTVWSCLPMYHAVGLRISLALAANAARSTRVQVPAGNVMRPQAQS